MHVLSLLHFKDTGYKFEPYVCSKCHDISMMAYKLKRVAICKRQCKRG